MKLGIQRGGHGIYRIGSVSEGSGLKPVTNKTALTVDMSNVRPLQQLIAVNETGETSVTWEGGRDKRTGCYYVTLQAIERPRDLEYLLLGNDPLRRDNADESWYFQGLDEYLIRALGTAQRVSLHDQAICVRLTNSRVLHMALDKPLKWNSEDKKLEYYPDYPELTEQINREILAGVYPGYIQSIRS